MIFQGPHAYVSPVWYEERLSVPTWDYVAVHARGSLRILSLEDAPHHVAELTSATTSAEFERLRTLPTEWLEQMARGIVAFEIDVTSLEGRFKLSQNRSLAEQANVARELRTQLEPPASIGAMIAANLGG